MQGAAGVAGAGHREEATGEIGNETHALGQDAPFLSVTVFAGVALSVGVEPEAVSAKSALCPPCHWILAEADGNPTVLGTCKRCGATREFAVSHVEKADQRRRKSALKGAARASAARAR